MPVVTFDLVSGHDVELTWDQLVVRRTARVTELVSGPEGQILEAITDPGVPQLGDAYPGYPQYRVSSVVGRPGGCDAVILSIEYGFKVTGSTWNQSPPVGRDGVDIKQFSGGLTQVKTTRDRTDTEMVLTAPAAVAGDYPDQVSEAQAQVPIGTIRFERIETQPVGDRQRTYLGKINSTVEGNYASRTLLCSRIDAQSADGGSSWRVQYEFSYRPGGWLHSDIWKLGGSNGIVLPGTMPDSFELYDEISFAALGLNFNDSQTPI